MNRIWMVEPGVASGVLRGLDEACILWPCPLEADLTRSDAAQKIAHLRTLFPEAPPENLRAVAEDMRVFATEIAEGHEVMWVLPQEDGKLRFRRGKITGPYRYRIEAPAGLRHGLPVEWKEDIDDPKDQQEFIRLMGYAPGLRQRILEFSGTDAAHWLGGDTKRPFPWQWVISFVLFLQMLLYFIKDFGQ